MGISVFRPTIRRRDMDSVLTCMVSDRIGSGVLSHELTKTVARYIDAEGGLAFSSYYTSLSMALDCLGLQPSDGVVISALAPLPYTEVLRNKGLVPLVTDVDLDSGAMLIENIEEHLKNQPKAIVLHYTLGFMPDMDVISGMGIPIVEDLSQSLGGCWGEQRCGSYGDLAVVSLSTDSIITCGEGGLVLARNRRMLGRLKEVAAVSSHPLSDLNASLGLAQMREIEAFVSSRRTIAGAFSRSLMRTRHKPLIQKGQGKNVDFSFPVLLDSAMDEIRRYARRRNIDTRPAFSKCVSADQDHSFPNARQMVLRCVLFPCYPMLGKRNIETISKVIASLP